MMLATAGAAASTASATKYRPSLSPLPFFSRAEPLGVGGTAGACVYVRVCRVCV